jgi:hypothetical protein
MNKKKELYMHSLYLDQWRDVKYSKKHTKAMNKARYNK